MKTLEILAEKLGFNIIYNTDNTNDPLYNDSAIAGNDIFIGEYDNIEYELISFFHEYGHYLIGFTNTVVQLNYNTLLIEIECWNKGIEAARRMGILFSDKTIEWAYNKALSYKGHDERESTSWSSRVKPTLWINRIDTEESLRVTAEIYFKNKG